MADGFSAHNRVDPTTSENKKVIVPVGIAVPTEDEATNPER
jgi:hypothetical protein